MYFFHSLQSQFFSFDSLILFLKVSTLVLSLRYNISDLGTKVGYKFASIKTELPSDTANPELLHKL